MSQDPILLKLNAGRVRASNLQPYLATAIFAMVPVKVEGLGTMASDEKWRLYYDPAKLVEWPLDELAGVLLHEVGHCIRAHGPRFASLGEQARFARTWNIAGDSVINEDLRKDGIRLPAGGVYIDTLVESGVPVDRKMSAEQIYRLIREKQDEECTCGQPQGQGAESGDQQGGSGSDDSSQAQPGDSQGDGQKGTKGGNSEDCPVHGHDPEGWDCGSAADAVKRAYEAEGDKIDAGVDEDRGDLIRQQVAVEIKNHIRNRGSVPAGYERWASELLEPVVDWRRELSSLVRRTFAQVAGLRDYSYQRPSRRQAAMRQSGQDIILPAMRQPNPPRVSIVIDTSGSMSDDMLSWALSETQGVLRSLGSSGRNITVISCDATATGKRVTRASDIKLTGGGGTDMRVGIDEAMNGRSKPDCVVVLTDGFTEWPAEPLRGATLIVALTDESAAGKVPSWARKVVVTR